MYENRITIFLDILGFRNIVEKTESNSDFAERIFCVLDSMKSKTLGQEMFGEAINVEVSEEERKKVQNFMGEISKHLMSKSTIQITHFSDSIVLSVSISDSDANGMSLFEYLARLQYRLWRDFNILIRGGGVVDRLKHGEGGALFGPAMVKAYDLESNLAIFPRIILDNKCKQIIFNSPSYSGMASMFKPFSGHKQIKDEILQITDGYEINLATSFSHLITSGFAIHESKRLEIWNVIQNSISGLEKLKRETKIQTIKDKYDYLINEINSIDYLPNFKELMSHFE